MRPGPFVDWSYMIRPVGEKKWGGKFSEILRVVLIEGLLFSLSPSLFPFFLSLFFLLRRHLESKEHCERIT